MDIVGVYHSLYIRQNFFALHTRLEIVCYAVNIANIMRGSSPIPDPNFILGRPEQIRVTCPSILLYSKATFHNLLIT